MSQKETEARKANLEQLRKAKVNPYPSKVEKKQTAKECLEMMDKDVSTAGRLDSIRSHGKSTFADLRDSSGSIQVFFKSDEIGEKEYKLIKLLNIGDYVQVKGKVFTTRAKETTILADSYKILVKTLLPVPDKWYGLKDVETRYRKRYLDMLLNEKVRKNLITRAQIVTNFREFMNSQGFLEVETPVLQAIPGGAAARPFETHYNILKQDMFLRISPELFLKRLIVGGFDKVYEIGRQFRNEGLSHMHNPEFTSMEFYWAYQDYQGIMEFTEKMIAQVVKKTLGKLKIKYQGNTIDLTPPFKRITFDELIKKDSGIDIYKYPKFEDLKKEVEKKSIDLNWKDIKVWAKLVDELYKKVSRPNINQPTFVIDQPLVLTPLAKAKEDEPEKAQRFQLVVGGGMEVVNAYTELNDPQEQEDRLKEQVKFAEKGWDESAMMDEDFIQALKYGLPPTAGWGLGIERFAMLLTDQYSIKEVIPFPTLKNLKDKKKE